MDKKRKNLYIVLVGILIIGLGTGGVLFYMKKHASFTIEEANVVRLGNGYIVVEDGNGDEYCLTTDVDYNLGDKVSFMMKDLDRDSYPYEGNVLKIDTISRNVTFIIQDNVDLDKEEVSKDSTDLESSSDNSTSVVDDQSSSVSYNDEEVVAYFEDLSRSLDNDSIDSNLGSSIKSGFVTIVDFLFYDGEIKGKTFDELGTSAKLKVLEIAFTIDSKIDKQFPGYKEQISSSGSRIYTNVKDKAVAVYLDITSKICADEEALCESAKEGLASLKKNFSLTWDFVKNAAGSGLTKIKDWYEVWKDAS